MTSSAIFFRPPILPSEKAFSYKMRLEAMRRQGGRPRKEIRPHWGQISEVMNKWHRKLNIYIERTDKPDWYLVYFSVVANKNQISKMIPVQNLENFEQGFSYGKEKCI